jgi:hypothetical protein
MKPNRKGMDAVIRNVRSYAQEHPSAAKTPEQLEALFYEKFLPGQRYPVKAPPAFRNKPVHLYPYQRKMIHLLFFEPRVIFAMGRQTGKTSILGLWLSFMLYHAGPYIVAVTAFGEIQSKLLLEWVRLWIYSHTETKYADMIVSSSAEHLVFRNQSSIQAFAHGRPLRGQSPNCLIVDEGQHTESEDMAAWTPTGVVTRPKEILMGTMWSPNWWYDRVTDPESYGYKCLTVKSTEAVGDNGPISLEELERHRKGLEGTGFFEQEYLLEVLATAGFAFPKDSVLKNVQPELVLQPPEGTVMVVGMWDSARSGQDQAAYVEGFLVQPALLLLSDLKTWNNTSVNHQSDYIRQRQGLYGDYPFTVVTDATGAFGKTCIDELNRKGVASYAYNISAQSRQQLVEKTKIALDLGQVGVYGEQLRNQLLTFSQTVTKTGNVQYGRPGHLDDLANAFMLGCWYAYDKTRGFQGVDPGLNSVDFVGGFEVGSAGPTSVVIAGTGQYSGQRPVM